MVGMVGGSAGNVDAGEEGFEGRVAVDEGGEEVGAVLHVRPERKD